MKITKLTEHYILNEDVMPLLTVGEKQLVQYLENEKFTKASSRNKLSYSKIDGENSIQVLFTKIEIRVSLINKDGTKIIPFNHKDVSKAYKLIKKNLDNLDGGDYNDKIKGDFKLKLSKTPKSADDIRKAPLRKVYKSNSGTFTKISTSKWEFKSKDEEETKQVNTLDVVNHFFPTESKPKTDKKGEPKKDKEGNTEVEKGSGIIGQRFSNNKQLIKLLKKKYNVTEASYYGKNTFCAFTNRGYQIKVIVEPTQENKKGKVTEYEIKSIKESIDKDRGQNMKINKLNESKQIKETYWIDNKEVMTEVDRLCNDLQQDGWNYYNDKYTGSKYYVIFAKRIDNKAEFKAIKYNHDHNPEVIDLTYRQVIGDEPMDSFDGLRRELGRRLLPQNESKFIKEDKSLSEDTQYSLDYRYLDPIRYSGHSTGDHNKWVDEVNKKYGGKLAQVAEKYNIRDMEILDKIYNDPKFSHICGKYSNILWSAPETVRVLVIKYTDPERLNTDYEKVRARYYPGRVYETAVKYGFEDNMQMVKLLDEDPGFGILTHRFNNIPEKYMDLVLDRLHKGLHRRYVVEYTTDENPEPQTYYLYMDALYVSEIKEQLGKELPRYTYPKMISYKCELVPASSIGVNWGPGQCGFPKNENESLNYNNSENLNESKSTHCVYFTQDGKDQVEFEGTEDECNKYISDIQAEQDAEFGDEAPERFIKRLTEGYFSDDDVEDDIAHANLYGGDTMYCRDCGTKKKWDDGYSYCPKCNDELEEAHYGGAFDIADDQYFTRDDLNDFAEEVLNHINETFKTSFDVSSCYIDNGILELCVTNDEYGDYIYSEKIDMRKIKEPWHLKRAYAFEFASQLINDITQSNDGLVESLDDDVDDLSYYYSEEDIIDALNDIWEEIASKQVPDSDGFYTDYTMYRNINTGEYVFVFGDKDIYRPEDGYFDWECETEQEATEWFDNYNGFDDFDDETFSED